MSSPQLTPQARPYHADFLLHNQSYKKYLVTPALGAEPHEPSPLCDKTPVLSAADKYEEDLLDHDEENEMISSKLNSAFDERKEEAA